MTNTAQPTIQVRQYRPEDHATVTKIYIEGLMAADPDPKYRFLWHELVRKDLTNDFADIEGSHMAPGGNFFVDPNFQRMSIGRKMILELENWAKEHRIKSLFLTTNANNPKPQAFYTSLGYTKVDENEYDWKEHQYFRVFKFIKQL